MLLGGGALMSKVGGDRAAALSLARGSSGSLPPILSFLMSQFPPLELASVSTLLLF